MLKRRGFLKALVAAVAAPAAVKAAVESPEAIGPKVEHVDPAEWRLVDERFGEEDFRAAYERLDVDEYTSEFGTHNIVRPRFDPMDTAFMTLQNATRKRSDEELRKLMVEFTLNDLKKPWGSP